MTRIDALMIGEVVHVVSKNENGAVAAIHPPTITVTLLTGSIEVHEGDFEKRS